MSTVPRRPDLTRRQAILVGVMEVRGVEPTIAFCRLFLPENLRRQTTKLRWSAPRKKKNTGKNACATAQPKPSLTCGNFRLVILSAQTFYLPPVPVLTAHKRGG